MRVNLTALRQLALSSHSLYPSKSLSTLTHYKHRKHVTRSTDQRSRDVGDQIMRLHSVLFGFLCVGYRHCQLTYHVSKEYNNIRSWCKETVIIDFCIITLYIRVVKFSSTRTKYYLNCLVVQTALYVRFCLFTSLSMK
jgi:hypothetical protein